MTLYLLQLVNVAMPEDKSQALTHVAGSSPTKDATASARASAPGLKEKEENNASSANASADRYNL